MPQRGVIASSLKVRGALIEVSQAGAQTPRPIAATPVRGEGLTAYARAAELRITS